MTVAGQDTTRLVAMILMERTGDEDGGAGVRRRVWNKSEGLIALSKIQPLSLIADG